jgi:hypothetical protein
MEQTPTGQHPNNQPTNLSQNSSQPSKKTWGIVGGVVVLVLVGLALGYGQYKKQLANNLLNPANQPNNIKVVDNPFNTANPATNPANQLPPFAENPPIVDPLSYSRCKNFGVVLSSKSGLLVWQKPELLEDLKIFQSVIQPDGYSDYGSDHSYKVGHFTSGQFKGGDLLLTYITYNAPGRPAVYRIVKQGELYTVLSKYSESLPDAKYIKSKVKLEVDSNFELADLNFPANLQAENPKLSLEAVSSVAFFKSGGEFFCQDGLVKIFSDPQVGEVYTILDPNIETPMFPKFGFYVKSPDSTVQYYKLSISFMGQNKVPLITWKNGQPNTKEYDNAHVGGCGAGEFLAVRDILADQLTSAGVTFDGQTVYVYKDSQATALKDLYEGMFVPEGKTKMTYEAFVNSRPIFFWQDPLGRMVEFKSRDYQPLAECGKPVIYLYPTETQKISVKVEPQGGMSVSIPAYHQGWEVEADPQSKITNLADGLTYPYLFWEGRGGIYQTPEKGFVVAKGEVNNFLQEKLHQLGLNAQETADFMEFWYPKMQRSPYYFITFLGNSAMDELAPLTISPKPDTIIRVLMDFVPLEKPIQVQGFKIRTPERKGFTVVEWGGVLK